MKLNIIYEDKNVLVVDKPAGIVVFSEQEVNGRGSFLPLSPSQKDSKTLIGLLLAKYPYLRKTGEKPRYGIVHRLDKDTSGILLVAKNNKTLNSLQKQFQARTVEKKYLALIVGHPKNRTGTINTLIGRSPKNRKKQKVYAPYGPKSKGKRNAITFYKVLKKFKNYDLVEGRPKTGRKHQIRAHFAYLGHPIAGDKIYGFKNQPCPKRLSRQFLHAASLKIKLPNGKIEEFKSELPKTLKKILNAVESQ